MIAISVELNDILIVVGIAAAPFIALLCFSIKAVVHKTNAPLRDKVNKLETKMLVLDDIPMILKELPSELAEEIDKRIKAREEIFNLKFATKQDLDTKQDKPH